MNDFIKKLQASTPTLTGEKASDYYDEIYLNRTNRIVYHSAVHGFDKVLQLIENFILAHAKVGPSREQSIYSDQPFHIGTFDIIESDHHIRIWYMVYTNCIIAYYKMGELQEISIVIDSEDIEDLLHGSQKS